MATLTDAQRLDMQGDLGISDDETVFTNAELDRLYTRADSDYNTAVYLAFRQLVSQANKYHNYTAGMTKVQLNQVRENIRDSLDFWKDEARTIGNQVRLVGLNQVPPRYKEAPCDVTLPDGWHDSEDERA